MKSSIGHLTAFRNDPDPPPPPARTEQKEPQGIPIGYPRLAP